MRNTFQYHSLKAVACHNHSRLGGIALHVLHSFQCFQQMEQTVVGYNGNRLIRLLGVEVSYYDIGPQAYHLVAYLMFETDHHRYRHNHDGQPDGYAQHSNADGRLGHLFSTLIAAIDASGNKELPVHISLLPFRDMLPMPYAVRTTHGPDPLSSTRRQYAPHYGLHREWYRIRQPEPS